MNPEAYALAQVLCKAPEPRPTVIMEEYSLDWIVNIQFIINLFYACLGILHELPGNRAPASLDEVNMAHVDTAIELIEKATRVRLTVTTIPDIAAQTPHDYHLVANVHTPLTKWFFVDKRLKAKLKFQRLQQARPVACGRPVTIPAACGEGTA